MLCVLELAGCVPSKESLSAGQIGCVPSEITISDEASDPGFVQSTQTWIAECHGKRFICSKTTTNSSNYVPSSSGGSSSSGWLHTTTDSDVACREALSDPSATATAPSPTPAPDSRVAAQTPAAPAPSTAKAEPPIGAGGFEFAFDASGARKACELAGKQWRDEGGVHTCSGLARDAGSPATAAFEFCGASTCSIELRFESPEKWLSLVTGLRGKLSEKYGAPESTSSLPAVCNAEPEFTRCFRDQGQQLQYWWGWSSGQRIELRIGGADSSQAPGIRLIYRKTPETSAVDASVL